MVARKKGLANLVAKALQTEREAVAFFRSAQRVSHNPKVRQTLEKLRKSKALHVGNLERIIKTLDLSVPELKHSAGCYPISELERAECYVCGFAIDTGSIPESCPRCGASRYAFEKEISARRAWEIAEKGAVAILIILREAEGLADARLRTAMAGQIRLEQILLGEARKQIEALKK